MRCIHLGLLAVCIKVSLDCMYIQEFHELADIGINLYTRIPLQVLRHYRDTGDLLKYNRRILQQGACCHIYIPNLYTYFMLEHSIVSYLYGVLLWYILYYSVCDPLCVYAYE